MHVNQSGDLQLNDKKEIFLLSAFFHERENECAVIQPKQQIPTILTYFEVSFTVQIGRRHVTPAVLVAGRQHHKVTGKFVLIHHVNNIAHLDRKRSKIKSTR